MKGKADLLLHPVRMRIIQQLLLGKPLTIAQLVEILGDIPQATLYRHMNLLLEANLVEVIETKKVKGTEERMFSVKRDNLHIPESEVEKTSREDHIQHFSVYHGNLFQLATSYLAETSPEQYEKEGFSYAYIPLHLSDEEFQELTQTIQQALEKVVHNHPTSARTTRIFASMFIPQDSQES
ncbi:helix-turn-helix domain-containing protein [Siminovitchia terrae]|nr:helix-turn-helix domain-containing protein [Siminovitchia terrae]